MKSLKDDEAERLNDSIVNRHDTVKLNQIIHKAELLLRNIGVKVNAVDIIFEIVEQDELNRLHPDMQRVVGSTCPVCIEGKCHKIWLLENCTYIFLLSVVAHEMGHTWCRDHRIKLSNMEEEGFCELLAYHVLSTQFSKFGNSWKISMMQNPDPVYGDGLRYMKKQLDICGNSWMKFLGLMKMCRT